MPLQRKGASLAENRLTNRAFGLAFAVVFGVITGIGWLLGGQVPQWAVATSAALLLLALIAPGILMPLNRIWTWLAHHIGFVTNHLLLGVFFYAVILPFGLVARLFGMRSIRRRPDPSVESYWTPVGRQATAETYVDMF
jgi:hypothetical protein